MREEKLNLECFVLSDVQGRAVWEIELDATH